MCEMLIKVEAGLKDFRGEAAVPNDDKVQHVSVGVICQTIACVKIIE